MASEYRLQIIHVKTGEVVKSWEPGGKAETDLVEDLCLRCEGFNRVCLDIAHVRKAFKALLHELKSKV